MNGPGEVFALICLLGSLVFSIRSWRASRDYLIYPRASLIMRLITPIIAMCGAYTLAFDSLSFFSSIYAGVVILVMTIVQDKAAKFMFGG